MNTVPTPTVAWTREWLLPPPTTYNPPPPITLPSVVFSHPGTYSRPFLTQLQRQSGAKRRSSKAWGPQLHDTLLPATSSTSASNRAVPFFFLLEAGIHEGKISRNWRDRTNNRWREAPNAKVDKQLTYNPPPHLYPPPPRFGSGVHQEYYNPQEGYRSGGVYKGEEYVCLFCHLPQLTLDPTIASPDTQSPAPPGTILAASSVPYTRESKGGTLHRLQP